jgi:hypothetical protein
MGSPKLSRLLAAAGAVALYGAVPVRAQCRLCDTPTTMRDAPGADRQVSLQIETAISFDRLVLSGAGDGSVLIRPDGSTSIQGAVAEVSPRAMVGSAVINGEPGRPVRVELPTRIVLRSIGGGEIEFVDVISDLPAVPKLDGNGRLMFRFGGRLRVRGDFDGEFRGDLPITVEYL